MAKDINSSVNYWNANYSGYGSMSKNMASMRDRLVAVGFASYNNLSAQYDAIYRFLTGAGKCFTRNSWVLMGDLTWKRIDEVAEGDVVFSSSGTSTVLHLHKTTLGFRKVWEFSDASLSFTSDHMFWVKKDSKDYFWCMSKKDLEFQTFIAESPILNDLDTVYEGVEETSETFAHINVGGWKEATPSLTTITASNFPLYSPILADGALMVVNGYLVDSATDENQMDYSTINWESLVTEEVSNAMNDLPDQYHQMISSRAAAGQDYDVYIKRNFIGVEATT